MMKNIAQSIWEEIKWISLTNKDLDKIILSKVGNPNIVPDIREQIHKISYEEAKSEEYIEEHVDTEINKFGDMEIQREALANGRYPLAAESFYITIIPEMR